MLPSLTELIPAMATVPILPWLLLSLREWRPILLLYLDKAKRLLRKLRRLLKRSRLHVDPQAPELGPVPWDQLAMDKAWKRGPVLATEQELAARRERLRERMHKPVVLCSNLTFPVKGKLPSQVQAVLERQRQAY